MNLDPSSRVDREVIDRFQSGTELQQPQMDGAISVSLEISDQKSAVEPQLKEAIAIMSVDEHTVSIQEDTVNFLKQSAHEFRLATINQLNAGIDGSSVQAFVDDCYRTMLTATFDRAEQILNEKGMRCPTLFAVGGLGSIARGETSPFSDLDFCILVADDNPEVRHYFTLLMTEISDILRQMGDKGFRLCNGELDPPYYQRWEENGKAEQSDKTIGSPQLLNTPKEMVRHSIESYSAEHEGGAPTGAEKKIIEQSLSQVGFVCGNKELVEAYHHEQETLMDRPVQTGITGYFSSRKLRHEKGVEIIKTGEKFDLQTGLIENNLQSGMAIDIKKGMQRQIQQIVSGLCMYHGIPELNTVLALDILAAKQVMNSALTERMKSSYSFASSLRLKAQVLAGKEVDTVTAKLSSDHYTLNQEEQIQLRNEARFLMSLTQLRRLFVESDGKSHVFLHG